MARVQKSNRFIQLLKRVDKWKGFRFCHDKENFYLWFKFFVFELCRKDNTLKFP